MSRQYGYLAAQRVEGGTLTMPDGTSQMYQGRKELDDAWRVWVEANALPAAATAVRRSREAFVAGCTVHTENIPQPGRRVPDLVRRYVLAPDGSALGNAEDDVAAQIARIAAQRFPDVNYEQAVRELREEDRIKRDYHVVWAVSLFANGEHTRLPGIGWWSFGLPIEGLLKVLDAVAADGWSVSHVSEDRGIFKGLTNQTDSAVTTIRYLLVRDRAM